MQRRLLKTGLIAFCISISIYLLPSAHQQPLGGGWGPAIDWGRFYIVQTGGLPQQIEQATYIEGLKNYGAVEQMPKILLAQINIITGVTVFPTGAYFLDKIPVVGLVIIPLFAIAWYRRSSDIQHHRWDVLLILLVALFPHATVLDNLSGGLNPSVYARGLFITSIYSYLRLYIEGDDRRWFILAVVTSVFMWNYYHTWAYYLFLYISTAGFVNFFYEKRQGFHYAVSISCLTFLIVGLYVNPNIVTEPFRLITTSIFLDDLFTLFQQPLANPYESLEYAKERGVYGLLVPIHTVTIGLTGLLFAFNILKNRYNHQRDRAGDALFILTIGHALVGGGLFIRSGFGALSGRFTQALTLMVILWIGYLASIDRPQVVKAAKGLAVLMVVLGLVGYLFVPAHQSSVSTQELKGAEFVGEDTSDIPVFADFRLGSPPLYFGKTELYTTHSAVDDYGELAPVLNNSYYSPSSPCQSLEEYLDPEQYLVLTSATQSELGVLDPYRRFEPADDGFQRYWKDDENYQTVYSNGEMALHSKRDTPCIT